MIIPALLTSNPRIAQERINMAKQMSGWIHIDLLNKTLYDFQSLSISELEKLDWEDLQLELHAMTNTPLSLIESSLPADRIILHYELKNWEEQYQTLVKKAVNTWVAIAPSTEIESIALPADVAGVVIMGVEPGQTGQSFREETYTRLDTFMDYFPATPVAIDGGVSEENLRSLVTYGVDNFIMGNALFGQRDPVAAYHQYERLSDPLGGSHDNQRA